jgi:lipopolysaccharide export system permease protein
MKTLDRYLAREMFLPLAAGLGGFVLLMLGNVLYVHWQLLREAGAGSGLIAELLALRAPEVAWYGLPFAALLAAAWCMSKLERDSELVAFRMAGIPLRRLLVAPMLLAAGVSVAAYVNGEHLVPWANHRAESLVRRVLLGHPVPIPLERVFFHVPPNMYVYIERMDPRTRNFSRAVIYELKARGFPCLQTAESGYIRNSKLVLLNGLRHELDAHGRWEFDARFDRATVNLKEEASAILAEQKTPKEMGSGELKRYISVFHTAGVDVTPMLVEYHFKFALPVAPLVATLLAVPLSIRYAGRGSMAGITLAFALAFAYQVLMSWARILAQSEVLWPPLAAWAPNVIFAGLGLWLIARQEAGR